MQNPYAGIAAGYLSNGTVTGTTAINCHVETAGMAATAGIGAGDQSQMVRPPKPAHPKGELSEMKKDPLSVTLEVDSFDGKIHVCDFLDSIKNIAPQLTPIQAWCRLLTKAISKFLKNGQVIAAQPLISSG